MAYWSLRWRRASARADDYFGRAGRRLGTAITHTMAVISGEAVSGLIAQVLLHWLSPDGRGQSYLLSFFILTIGISALVIPAYYAARRDGNSWRWDGLTRRLKQRAQPDSGDYYTPLIAFQIRRREKQFGKQFDGLPGQRSELILVLKQITSTKGNNHDYETESLRRQIRIAEASVKAKNMLPGAEQTKLRWVCFVTKAYKFVAFEDFDIFRVRLLDHSAAEYVTILNIVDTKKFEEALEVHAFIYDYQKRNPISSDVSGTPVIAFDKLIPDLQTFAIEEGLSQEDVLRDMGKHGVNEAMLVTQGDHKPVGVISVRNLALRTLGGTDKDDTPHRGPSDGDAQGEEDVTVNTTQQPSDQPKLPAAPSQSYEPDDDSDAVVDAADKRPHEDGQTERSDASFEIAEAPGGTL